MATSTVALTHHPLQVCSVSIGFCDNCTGAGVQPLGNDNYSKDKCPHANVNRQGRLTFAGDILGLSLQPFNERLVFLNLRLSLCLGLRWSAMVSLGS